MEPRPNRLPPQKLCQARAAFRKAGCQPRLSEQEHRELQRGAELLQRAERIKAADRRKKLSLQKRLEKEQHEREAQRRRLLEDRQKGKVFVGSTQFPRSQFRIERFITGPEETQHNISGKKQRETQVDPWDDDGVDDGSLAEILDNCEVLSKRSPTQVQLAESPQLFHNNTMDDFDIGLSTQDFEAIEVEFPCKAPAKHSPVARRTAKQQDGYVMPPPACPQSQLLAGKKALSLLTLDFSGEDLDLVALADFNSSQVNP
ncbi:MAG: hypothetical protein M1821_002071 [Bathelium mastoideum]|nr:MAG: hypothetical protein M1821_002071 [Bathelium mastoideum]